MDERDRSPSTCDTGEPEEADDDVLVGLAQHAPRRFEPLYLRYQTAVLAYCYRRLGNRDDAEDIASAAFVAALRGLAMYDATDGSFRAWLFTIVRNEVAMHRRWHGRHPVHPLDAATGVIDAARPPEECAILVDDQLRLAGLLCSLTPREREVLELRLANLTTGEIARVLAISDQNVRTTQSRAISRLRTAFAAGDVAGEGVADA